MAKVAALASLSALALLSQHASANDQPATIRYEFEHSFKRPFFKPEKMILPYWQLGESAALSEHSVLLVPAVSSRKGWVWNKKPAHMKDWEIKVDFGIYGRSRLGADGMAIWYTQDHAKTGEVFGAPDRWQGLGIIIDTYDNDSKGDNPVIMGILNNGQKNYNMHADGEGDAIGSCKAPFKGAPSLRNPINPTTLKVTYQNRRLTVSYDMAKSGVFTECFAADNINLPEGYYFGVSAATGGLADDHNVYKFETWNLSPPKKDQAAPLHGEVKYEDHLQLTPEEEAQLQADYHKQMEALAEARKKWEAEHPGEVFNEDEFWFGQNGEGAADSSPQVQAFHVQDISNGIQALRDMVDLNFRNLHRRMDDMQRQPRGAPPGPGHAAVDPQLAGQINALLGQLRAFDERMKQLEQRMVQQQHVVKEDIKRALKEETATIGKTVAEGGSYTVYVIVLIAMQIVFLFIYAIYKRATDDSSKKFI